MTYNEVLFNHWTFITLLCIPFFWITYGNKSTFLLVVFMTLYCFRQHEITLKRNGENYDR